MEKTESGYIIGMGVTIELVSNMKEENGLTLHLFMIMEPCMAIKMAN